MSKYFTISILALLSLFSAAAQDIKMVPGAGLQVKNTSAGFISHTKQLNGGAYEDFSTAAKVHTMEKGNPAVPVHSASLIVPNTGGVSLSVSYDGFEEFDNIEVLPSKGSLKRNVAPAAIPYEFGAAYQQDAFYPGNLAVASDPYILRDKRGVTVSFYPYQYNPVSKKLRVYRNITASIAINPQVDGINEKNTGSAKPVEAFNDIYGNFFLNSAQYMPLSESGEMLIITPQAYLEALEPLVNWKRKKGIRTTVATLAQTGSTDTSIKNYIQNFYAANPGMAYVLLVGDHDDLPSHTYGLSGSEELWSDSYYGQLEGSDFFPEALVGRFSGTVANVATMVARTLEYETSPLAGDWVTHAMGIGSNEGYEYGDDGQADWEHLRGIGDLLLNNGYTHIYEFYESSQGLNDADGDPTANMIADAINNGAGLVNYTGHGSQNMFSTGYFSDTHVNQLRNNGKYPFVVSVACNNGTFTSGTSLCEAFMNVRFDNLPAGAIAAAGSSILMAWAEPMQTQDEMTELIIGSQPDNKKTTLGGLFYNGQLSMLEAYSMSQTAIVVMQTWILFGDPSVVFRSSEATPLIAQHVPQLSYMANTVAVHCATEGAIVAITQNGVILGTGVVTGGVAHITLNDFVNSTDVLNVTVTQQNFIPYQGTIALEALGTDNFSAGKVYLYPNPASDFIKVSTGTAAVDLEIRDSTGKLIHTALNAEGGMHTINTSGFASGIYLLTIMKGEVKVVTKFVVK
jgi:gingipain R